MLKKWYAVIAGALIAILASLGAALKSSRSNERIAEMETKHAQENKARADDAVARAKKANEAARAVQETVDDSVTEAVERADSGRRDHFSNGWLSDHPNGDRE